MLFFGMRKKATGYVRIEHSVLYQLMVVVVVVVVVDSSVELIIGTQ